MKYLGFALLTALAAYFLVGIEKVVDDHERGISWESFIKHQPSLQTIFENPLWQSLELTPIEKASQADIGRFRQYCKIRYGEDDIEVCHQLVAKKMNI